LFSGLRGEVNGGNQMINPQEYEHFLKYKLDLACAAVALTRQWQWTKAEVYYTTLSNSGIFLEKIRGPTWDSSTASKATIWSSFCSATKPNPTHHKWVRVLRR
jgi:hypothetical protein